MEAWQQYFYYADELKEKNANEEHFSTFQTPKGLSIPREQVVLRPGRGQRRKTNQS